MTMPEKLKENEYYHGTKSTKSIMKHGLKPRESHTGIEKSKEKKIFLTKNREYAEDFAKSGWTSGNGEILKVRLTKAQKSKLKFNPLLGADFESTFSGRIRPEQIKRLPKQKRTNFFKF